MRLTEAIRSSISGSVIELSFQGRKAALEKRLIATGEALYLAIIGPHERKLKALPKDWPCFSDEIEVRNRRGGRHSFPLKKKRIFPFGNDVRFLVPPALDKEVEQLALDDSQLKTDMRKRSNEVWTVLAGVNTLARLLELWPEVEPLIPDSILADGMLPVSADVAKLNRELGLQPKSSPVN